MKNQNDLIFSVVFIFLGLVIGAILFFGKRDPQGVPNPDAVVITPAKVEGAEVKMASALPSGDKNASGGSSMAAGGGPALGRPTGGSGGSRGGGGRPMAAGVSGGGKS